MKAFSRGRSAPAAPSRWFAIALFCGCGAHAATTLEYVRDGQCPTEFERMTIDGLHARIDLRVEDMSMSTLFDDGEQIMYQLLHDARTYMTMESDDDAVDLASDIGKSVSLYAEKRTQAATGLSGAQGMAAFRDAQVAACPEMAALGFADPDYAEAAQRCAEKMARAAPAADGDRRNTIAQQMRQREARPLAPAKATAGAPVKWSTTTVERAGTGEIDGRACTHERIVRGDAVLREDCMAAIESLGLDARAQRRLKRIVTVGKGMSEGIASLHPQADPDRDRPAAISLERTCYRGGVASGHARLRIRKDTRIDRATFELPGGYEPMQMVRPMENASPAQALELLEQSGSRRH